MALGFDADAAKSALEAAGGNAEAHIHKAQLHFYLQAYQSAGSAIKSMHRCCLHSAFAPGGGELPAGLRCLFGS